MLLTVSRYIAAMSKGVLNFKQAFFPVQANVWYSLQTAPIDNKKQFNIESISPLSITTSTPIPRNTFDSKFRAGNGQ